MDDIFDRRRGETAQAYEAARIYFDLRANRSIAAVGQKLGKSKALMERWSARWSWVERARAYDGLLDQEVRKAIAAAAQRVAKDWEAREQAYRQRKYEIHLRGLDKFDRMIEFPLASVTTETVEGPNGSIIRRTTVKPAKWTFDTAHRLAREMFALGRQALRNEEGVSGGESADEREEDWTIEDFNAG